MSGHAHTFPHWTFKDAMNTVGFSTARVAHDGFPVLQVAHDANGDWQFLDATTDDPGECILLCLGCIFERDPTLADISDLPRGWGAFRLEVGAAWERWEHPPEDDDCGDEEKALADIATHGLHILHIAEEGDLPPFSYSIGIEQSLGQPELIVIGLKAGVAHAAINACFDHMKAGTRIEPGVRVAGLLGGGFECLIGAVSPTHFRDYMGWARWLYKDKGFRAQQIIFPNTSGVFPWEAEANDWFRQRQPLLSLPASESGQTPQPA